MSERDFVLVGVDGSEAAAAAIRYAVQEAQRRGSALQVVHLVPNYVPITPMRTMEPADLDVVGAEIVHEAADQARSLLGAERVTASVHHGPRVVTLLDLADQAGLIVLGVRQRPAVERLLTGSTLYGVASRAAVPVVAVPGGWEPGKEHHRVIAGVKSTQHSRGLVRRALNTAAERDAELVLLHAWELPGAYDNVIAARVDREEWRQRAEETIGDSLHDLRQQFQEVPVEVRVVHGQPARVLQLASATADLLMVARRRSSLPFGHLGGTGRALLPAAKCPLQVFPSAEEK